MSISSGIGGQSLGKLGKCRNGSPVFVLEATATASDTSVALQADAEKKFRVIYAWGIMTGAGGAGDTAQLKNGTTAITEAADVSAYGDKTIFDFTELDDAAWEVAKGGSLNLATASGATCSVVALCVNIED